MIVACVRNVAGALAWGVEQFQQLEQDPRNIISPRGNRTVEFPSPVTTVYYYPTQRVLVSPERDANPFFHLFESLWMLAGRNDLALPQVFNSKFSAYSDDGVTIWGAYGWRWRGFFGTDQIADIIRLLRQDPTSRRAVLGMWSAGEDLHRAEEGGKDVPCNTHIYFKIRNGNELNMTVCNRSNDMLWGAYGANAVHMSMLQEYVANKLGVEVGLMRQVSDSLHVYLDGPGGELWQRLKAPGHDLRRDPYTRLAPYPLGAAGDAWDTDNRQLLAAIAAGRDVTTCETEWFNNVAVPMWRAYLAREPDLLNSCVASDWRWAGREWLMRRAK